ncbi:MAG TPA: TetR family transcriptional regulator [Thauera sp.]|nr:TetR family transcriptional regulator [Thauera sp.]
MNTAAPARDDIVDAALLIAERIGWEAVRLHQVAAQLGITLDDIRRHFREKEELVDAWFDRADAAMLQAATLPGFTQQPARLRLQQLMMAWFAALAPHRRVTRDMILGKLEPGHLHVQIPGLLRVSRTVQWLREAAGRDATFVRRALEETALTTIYLASFAHWLNDESLDAERTRRFVERRLTEAERLDQLVFRSASPARADEAPTRKPRADEMPRP